MQRAPTAALHSQWIINWDKQTCGLGLINNGVRQVDSPCRSAAGKLNCVLPKRDEFLFLFSGYTTKLIEG